MDDRVPAIDWTANQSRGTTLRPAGCDPGLNLTGRTDGRATCPNCLSVKNALMCLLSRTARIGEVAPQPRESQIDKRAYFRHGETPVRRNQMHR